ncbi:MAG TPA: hypothetical protein VJT33_02020 [bacterium]|nr:hypothetical protein [bacterium]
MIDGARDTEVRVGGTPAGPEVPPDFLGFSFETTALHAGIFGAGRPVLARLFANLGRGLLRFGGSTLDRSVWAPDGGAPAGNLAVTSDDLKSMFAFANQVGWKVLLGLNLGRFNPREAADEAAAAAQLGGGTLAAFEFGNEPDLYVQTYTGPLRPSSYDASTYRHEWDDYLRAVRGQVPTATVVGPGIAGVPGSVAMLQTFIEAERAVIPYATAHHYPLGAPITDPESPSYASIGNLLSPDVRQRDTDEIGTWARTAADLGTTLRLTETNSVFGGGKHGVSDTLAGALWTVDYLYRVASLGMIGINLHVVPGQCGGYTPFCAPTVRDARADRFQVQPNYYALLLFHLAARGRLVPTRVAGNARVTAYTTRDAVGTTRIALIDSGAEPVDVAIRVLGLEGRVNGTLLRLTGSSLAATDGVTLGGSAVQPDGTWNALAGDPVVAVDGTARLLLPPASVTVLTLPTY